MQLEFRIKRHSRMLAEGINLLCGSIRAAWQSLIHILMGYQVVRWLLQYHENVTNTDEPQQQQVQRSLGENACEGEEEAAGREEETDKECFQISCDNRNIINATAVMGNAGSSKSSSNSRGSNSRSRSNSTRNKSVQKRHSEV